MAIIEFLVAFALVTIVIGALRLKKIHGHWKRKNVAYIQPSIPLGNLENPFTAKRGLAGVLNDAYEKFKREGERFGGIFVLHKPVLVPVDPDLIKSIMTKDFRYFMNRSNALDLENEPLSSNLMTLENEKWKDLRARLSPAFTSGKMKLAFDTMTDPADQMIDHVRRLTLEGKPLDVKEIISCYTTDVIGSYAFGLECNSFKNSDADFRKYGRKLTSPSFMNSLRLFVFFVMPELNKVLRLRLMDEECANFFLNTFKEVFDRRTVTDSKRQDFIGMLMDIGNHRDTSLSLEEMVGQAILFFVAGFDTSSSTLSYALYQLALHQDVQDKVRKEIFEISNRFDGEITYESLVEMKYMDRVIDEVLRLYPSLPFITRRCSQEYTIPGTNVQIEKDTNIMIDVLALHTDEEYYPDAEKFNPERFSKEEVSKRHGYTYLPFGEGPRVCIGRRLGLLLVKIGLALMLKNFKVVLHETTPKSLKPDTKAVTVTFPGDVLLNSEFV